MAKGKSPKRKGETRVSFMFPSLHQNVVNAVADKVTSIWFHENNSDRDVKNEYSTHVMGKFKCKGCFKNGWSSKKVAILIKGYAGNGYNAEVFNQRYKFCDQLGILTLDKESYVDRVAYRLKKWAGVSMKKPYYSPKKGLPHESSLCEGCKRGLCQQTNN